jgi:hypothetical protein
MKLPKEAIEHISQDIWKVMLELKGSGMGFRLDNIDSLQGFIYRFYHSHAAALVKEDLEIFKTKLRDVHSQLSRIHGLTFRNDKKEKWYRYYTFDYNNEDELNSCVFRVYLNPTIEHFDIIVKAVQSCFRTYSLSPAKIPPLQFKFIDPNRAEKKHLERADKIVFYISHIHLRDMILKELFSCPPDWYYDAVPLFTKKVHRGIGLGYQPKKESAFKKILRGLTTDKSVGDSYGDFMAYAIALGLKEVITGTLKRSAIVYNFSTFSDHELRVMHKSVFDFVIVHANEGLHI